mmetsp:Transcript_35973/g.57307  ORF Transcript_35973/g.57307 Transcript_35973/m.57307 type:complete len:241 (-) Transcript_35973:762-1484(-)
MSSKKIPRGSVKATVMGKPCVNLHAPVGLLASSASAKSLLAFFPSPFVFEFDTCSKKSVTGKVTLRSNSDTSFSSIELTSCLSILVNTAPARIPLLIAGSSTLSTTTRPNSRSLLIMRPSGLSSNVTTSGGGEKAIAASWRPSFFKHWIFDTNCVVVSNGTPPIDLALYPARMPSSSLCEPDCTSVARKVSLKVMPNGLVKSILMMTPFSIWLTTACSLVREMAFSSFSASCSAALIANL